MRPNFLKKKSSFLKHRADILFVVFLALLIGSVHLVIANDVENKLSVLNERIAFLQKEIARNGKVKRKLKELRRTEAELAKRSSLLRMLKERKSVPPIVNYFAEKGTPEGVWLEELKVSPTETKVAGGAEKINNLVQLMKEVSQFGAFSLEGVAKSRAEFKELGKVYEYYNFSLKR